MKETGNKLQMAWTHLKDVLRNGFCQWSASRRVSSRCQLNPFNISNMFFDSTTLNCEQHTNNYDLWPRFSFTISSFIIFFSLKFFECERVRTITTLLRLKNVHMPIRNSHQSRYVCVRSYIFMIRFVCCASLAYIYN